VIDRLDPGHILGRLAGALEQVVAPRRIGRDRGQSARCFVEQLLECRRDALRLQDLLDGEVRVRPDVVRRGDLVGGQELLSVCTSSTSTSGRHAATEGRLCRPCMC